MKMAITVTAGCLLFVSLSVANAADGLQGMISNGDYKFDFRYRYEDVDQDNIDQDAGASTLRTRFTWTSATVSNFGFGLEVDHVTAIGSERYNSTENGNIQYPVVADPEGFDLNQSYVKYMGEKMTSTGGRQRILLGTQRFVGGVGWRQNEQTYDGIRAVFELVDTVSLDYSYVWNVNRIFGPDDGVQPADWHGDSHLLTLTWPVNETSKLEGFTYLLDFENGNGMPNSTATYGLGYSGAHGPLNLSVTYARQSDYKDSPLSYDADYFQLQAAYGFSSMTFTLGYEVLGSDDGMASFRTPLATLHKFQGWADKFLVTPANGIEDAYVGISGKLGPVALAATWHDFSAEESSGDYGTEFDLAATYAVHKNVTAQLKYANYSEDGFSTDTTKYWLSLMIKL